MLEFAPILLYVFLCFFVFVAACVILLFVAMISIARKLAPVVFSIRQINLNPPLIPKRGKDMHGCGVAMGDGVW